MTVAYRLGALGFVGHPALRAEGGRSSGEYAVLDQLAALRWTHGSPKRVACCCRIVSRAERASLAQRKSKPSGIVSTRWRFTDGDSRYWR